jgi:hypothetical protein
MEKALAVRLGLFTATVLQLGMELVCVPEEARHVARRYALARISIHRHKML